MARTTIKDLKTRRLASATATERAEFDETYAAAALAIRVGEQIRDAREAAELSQRDLAARMGTSQAAIARLEAGGVGATLTTLQRATSAVDLDITVASDPRAEQTLTRVSWRVHGARVGIRCHPPSNQRCADLARLFAHVHRQPLPSISGR